jgi:hypothetical protein
VSGVCAILLGTLAAPVGFATVAQAAEVSPPAALDSTCSTDVSQPFQTWLEKLPADTTVVAPAGACYLVDEGIKLSAPSGLTISGGTWEDGTVPQSGGNAKALNPVIWLVGGTDVALENMTIVGKNPGGYLPAGAFVAGIRSDGVIGLNISGVSVDSVYGDGIELAPLRAQGDIGSTILNPTKDVTMNDISIVGSGRQGITLASVSGAVISSVRLAHVGLDVFDVEADQWDEGARNVTINGCTVGAGNGGLFFANGGSGGGSPWTQNITVENCTMSSQEAGDAILIQTPADQPTRGPFTFTDDTLRCGASAYVACVEVTGGNVSINQSTLIVPPGAAHATVYDASNGSTVALNGDTVLGYGTMGTVDKSSSVNVSGGTWTAFAPPAPVTTDSPVPSAVVQNGSGSASGVSTGGGAQSAALPSPATTAPAASAAVSSALATAGHAGAPSGPASHPALSGAVAPPGGGSAARSVLLLILASGCLLAAALILRRHRRVPMLLSASTRGLLERPFGA